MRDYAETIKNLRETAKGLLFDAMPYRASVMKDAADAIEELLAELTTIRKQLPHWISVEDELPESGERVLIMFEPLKMMKTFQSVGSRNQVLIAMTILFTFLDQLRIGCPSPSRRRGWSDD